MAVVLTWTTRPPPPTAVPPVRNTTSSSPAVTTQPCNTMPCSTGASPGAAWAVALLGIRVPTASIKPSAAPIICRFIVVIPRIVYLVCGMGRCPPTTCDQDTERPLHGDVGAVTDL